jgi:hypothetical protein
MPNQNYPTTAITITHLKDALVYFDHAISVTLMLEAVHEGMRRNSPAGAVDIGDLMPPPALRSEMLPPEFASSAWFQERLQKANDITALAFVKMHHGTDEDRLIADNVAKWMIGRVVEDFHLEHLPVIVPPGMAGPGERSEHADVALSLSCLKLVDADNATWEQLMEFRRDKEAQQKVRRLRLFVHENYTGKPKAFIEDDLLIRIADHDDTVKKWGFESKYAALTNLFNSDLVKAGLLGTFVSTLFHEPLAAVLSATTPLAIELGRFGLEIGKQQFAYREVMKNPVSYVTYAKEKLAPYT